MSQLMKIVYIHTLFIIVISRKMFYYECNRTITIVKESVDKVKKNGLLVKCKEEIRNFSSHFFKMMCLPGFLVN